MIFHNPKQIIEQLQLIMSNPSKKIGFLFGAGISMKDKNGNDLIMGSDEMTNTVISLFTKSPQEDAINFIKNELIGEGKKFNIETILSKISEKERAVGTEKLCGLSHSELTSLRVSMEEQVREIVSIHGSVNLDLLIHNDFARWIKNVTRQFQIEIFTTNYDYLLELSLESHKVPYFDGFIGSHEAFFAPELIENESFTFDWVKLWKLHGSLGWLKKGNGEIVRGAATKESAMIYPSFLKYDHSRKQPYLSYMDRLAKFLRQDDSVLFICGYSFGDEHINDLILTNLHRGRSSHVFVLKAGELKESDLLYSEIALKNPKVSVYALKTAVIGTKYGEWRLPSKEVELDAFKEDKSKTDPAWNGSGVFLLGNFQSFIKFLSDFYTLP